MVEKGYGVNSACVYKKVKESVFTYVYCCTMNSFLHALVSDMRIADAIAQHLPALIGLLCDPHCRLIHPIRIDLDYIEVLPKGTCFHIPTKSFVVNPSNIGGSARAFVHYTYKEDVVPFPRQFVEGKLRYFLFKVAMLLTVFCRSTLTSRIKCWYARDC